MNNTIVKNFFSDFHLGFASNIIRTYFFFDISKSSGRGFHLIPTPSSAHPDFPNQGEKHDKIKYKLIFQRTQGFLCVTLFVRVSL